jgi:EpsI family protein
MPTSVLAVLVISTLLIAPSVISEHLKANVNPLSNDREMPVIEEWSALSTPQGELLLPDYKGADLTIASSYQRPPTVVQAAIAYYATSRSGVSLIDHSNRIVDKGEWAILTAEKNYQVAGSAIKEVIIRSGTGSERVVWFWYRVGGMDVIDKYRAKMYEVFGVLAGRPDGALIAISAGFDFDPDEARAALTLFYQEAKPGLDDFVDNLARG